MGMTDTHAFIFDPKSGDLRELTNRWDAAVSDMESDSSTLPRVATCRFGAAVAPATVSSSGVRSSLWFQRGVIQLLQVLAADIGR